MVKWLNLPDDEDDNYFLNLLEDTNLASWYAVAVSLAVWVLFYFFVQFFFPNKSPEWCVRILAMCHGLGALIKGLPECVQDNGELVFYNPDEDSTRNQMLLLVISVGYFVFDLGWCLAYETETRLMILHHIYSCIALYRMLVSEVGGGQSVCGLAAMEITNPFLQLRWFLRSEGYYETPFFKFVEVTFIVLFFLVRIVFGTYFIGVIISNSSTMYEQKLFATMVYILSWVIYANIVKFVYLRYVQCIIQLSDTLQ